MAPFASGSPYYSEIAQAKSRRQQMAHQSKRLALESKSGEAGGHLCAVTARPWPFCITSLPSRSHDAASEAIGASFQDSELRIAH
jgi:hypothetical protein